ncbi:hypothetical protein [Fusibacillus kribbianus]|uniref:Uncharacterized protein n=1 Tax=Fusibacillus kribbianus TaxID=3044208 RepID=A0AAP4EWT4_9FIRM|nr:hypothetical protein [Ruminococcus sp. YH-rum2234]MDI9241824.1 hypothetical protein [Ruminococcus sp. YH-rum2234]
MDDKVHFQRNPDYIYREAAGEAVLVPVGKSFAMLMAIRCDQQFYIDQPKSKVRRKTL